MRSMDSRPPTLQAARAEQALQRDGFAVLGGVARDSLPWLRDVSEQFGDRLGVAGPLSPTVPPVEQWTRAAAPGPHFRSAVNEPNTPDRERFLDTMAPFWARIARRACVDHRIVTSSLITKAQGPDSVVPLHQDPNLVDERRYRSVTLWIPLEDVSAEAGNGPLHALVGSHLVADALRGIRIMPSFTMDMARLWPHTVPIEARAGDVVVLDSRLVHGSTPNETATARATVAAIAVPTQAPLEILVAATDDAIEVRGVDDQWYRTAVMRALFEHPPTEPPLLATLDPPDRAAVRRRLLDAYAA